MKIVYTYLDPRKPGLWKTTESNFDFEPFYIGEGKITRRFDHLTDNGPSHKARRIREIIAENLMPIIVIIKEGLTKEESVSLETSLIKQLGTRAKIKDVERGPLTNQRLYGKRGNISAETKAKMSFAKKGIKFTDEHREKLSAARAGRSYARSPQGPLSKEHKKKLSLAMKGRTFSKESLVKMSIAQKGHKTSDRAKANISAACKGRLSPNTKDWQIDFESGEVIVVRSLRSWCLKESVILTSLRNTLYSNKFYKGMKLKHL